ncbi:MAG: zf-HC2 domain-containing protein [Candidatus Aminicenantes bacterium]|nr:zf-HC2 domain-containing protein [Candidatus Aminicenantes bacterium]
MNCLTIEEIYKYIENELNDQEREKVEKHISTCPRCLKAVEERKLITRAAQSLPDLKLPDDFSQAILNQIFPPKISLKGWLAAFTGGIASSAIAFAFLLLISGYDLAAALINIYREFIDIFRNISILAVKFVKTMTVLLKVMLKFADYGIKGIVGAANLLNTQTQLFLIFITIAISLLLLIKMRRIISKGETA